MQAIRRVLPSISCVVARSYPKNIIGLNNAMPWHMPSDLRRFKRITSGHAIVMGRNTFLSIGRPLPQRLNIVISRSTNQPVDGPIWSTDHNGIVWANNVETALLVADLWTISAAKKEIFIIGGSQMYSLFEKQINKIYLTEILTQQDDGSDIDGDAFFERQFLASQWKTIHEESCYDADRDQYKHEFKILERRVKFTRQMDVSEFMADFNAKKSWIAAQLKAPTNRGHLALPVSGMDLQPLFESLPQISDTKDSQLGLSF